MKPRRGPRRRRGATLVESALILVVFLTLILGMLDLGMAVFRQQILSHAARQGGRRAIVHGSQARSTWYGGPWGTSQYGPVAANDSGDLAQAVAPFLSGMDPGSVTITATWVDGSNNPEKRVRVSLSTTYTPIITNLFGTRFGSLNLTASSTMQIAH